MQVEQASTETGKTELTIALEWDEVSQDYADILKPFSAASVPGFRPGKVPPAVIQKRFGDDIMRSFTESCGARFVREVIDERELRAVGRIRTEVVDLKKGAPVEIRCSFYTEPEFELPDCATFSATSEEDEEQRDELSEWLLAQTGMNVPDELVEEEMLFGDQPDPEDEKAVAAQREGAFERVKLMLILKAIARRDGVEVTEEDVDERIAEMALEFGMRSTQVRQELVQGGGMTRLRDMLIAEETLDYLLD